VGRIFGIWFEIVYLDTIVFSGGKLMFNELFERIFRLDESEEHIRAIYKVYKDHERNLSPEIVDLDTALEGMKDYYREYIGWWKYGYGIDEPKELKAATEILRRLGRLPEKSPYVRK